MELWNYLEPPATALWNKHDARAGESTETTAHDSDESDTEHPLEEHLSPYLRPSSTVLDEVGLIRTGPTPGMFPAISR